MNITIINASPNVPSNSALLGELFLEGVKKQVPDVIVQTIHVYNLNLPYFTIDKYSKQYVPSEAEKTLEATIRTSDAIVITTPIWNFGVPSPLKNVTDHLGRFCLSANPADKLPGTPVFIIFTGGAPKIAWHGMLKKTTLFVQEGWRYMGATPIGSLYIGGATKGPGQFELVLDQRTDDLQTAKQAGEGFAQIVQKFVQDGSLPITSKYYGKAMQVGQKVLTKLFSR